MSQRAVFFGCPFPPQFSSSAALLIHFEVLPALLFLRPTKVAEIAGSSAAAPFVQEATRFASAHMMQLGPDTWQFRCAQLW